MWFITPLHCSSILFYYSTASMTMLKHAAARYVRCSAFPLRLWCCSDGKENMTARQPLCALQVVPMHTQGVAANAAWIEDDRPGYNYL